MSNCKACDDQNPIERVGDCAADATPAVTSTAPCVDMGNGKLCPDTTICSPWDLTQGPEDCLISDYIQEQLNIAGTVLKVFKLLGVHEQGLLQDVTGAGEAISSGSLANNPASNAFDKYVTEWRSLQKGADVVRTAYLGYDFGPIRLDNGRLRYGLDTSIVMDISTIKIMQGCDSKNRVTKVRVERSEDGKKWYGVSLLSLKDCDGILTITFKRSVPSRYWRIRPLEFNGGADDHWIVRVLQMIEYEATAIGNIQDKILLENRDRDYQEFAIDVKATYTPQENASVLSQFGLNQMADAFMFDVSYKQVVQQLGRPFVVGDIIMVPSERQYSAALRPIDKYLQVTDVFWSATGFTPSWTPTVQKIVAKPVLASQETQDITGKLTADTDTSGLFDINDGNDGKIYQDYMDANDSIRAENKKNVPVKGIDYANSPVISDELKEYAAQHPNMNVDKLNVRRLPNGIDAMPPNGLPYTEGDSFPANPANGAYHRLTYTSIGVGIPARLHKYSTAKGRWIYLETDRKASINDHRPFLQEYLDTDGASSRTPLDKIDDTLPKS